MNDLPLFDRPAPPALRPTAPYVAHSVTSRAAARAIAPECGTIRAAVLAYLIGQGPAGAIDEEIERGLGIHHDTARARRVELRDAGRVVDSDKTRKTSSGREATVWIARGQGPGARVRKASAPPTTRHPPPPTRPAATRRRSTAGSKSVCTAS